MIESLKLGDSLVELADAPRNMGVIFNSAMSLTDYT